MSPKPEATEAMAAFAVERFGRLDVLHNNVGVGAGGNTVTQSLDDWNRLLAANLTSAMLCCRAAIPRMLRGRRRLDHQRLVQRRHAGPFRHAWARSPTPRPRPACRA